MHWIILTGIFLITAIVLFKEYPLLAVLSMVSMGACSKKITSEAEGMFMGLVGVVALIGIGISVFSGIFNYKMPV